MATLRLDLYGPPGEELARLSGERVPRWAGRLYMAYGHRPPDVPLSRVVHALSEEMGTRLHALSVLLDKAEEMGWHVRIEGDHAYLTTALEPDRSEDALDRAGVLSVARLLAPAAGDGGLDWTR